MRAAMERPLELSAIHHHCPYCDSWVFANLKLSSMSGRRCLEVPLNVDDEISEKCGPPRKPKVKEIVTVPIEGPDAEFLRKRGLNIDDLVTQIVKILNEPESAEEDKKKRITDLFAPFLDQLSPKLCRLLIHLVLNAVQAHPNMAEIPGRVPLAREAAIIAYEDMLRRRARVILSDKAINNDEKSFRLGQLFETAIEDDDPRTQEEFTRRVLAPLAQEPLPLAAGSFGPIVDKAVPLVKQIRAVRKSATKKAGPNEETPLTEETRAHLVDITARLPRKVMESRYRALAHDIPEDEPDDASKMMAADRLRRAWEGRKPGDDELIEMLLELEAAKPQPRDLDGEIRKILVLAGDGLSFPEHAARLRRLQSGVRERIPRSTRFHEAQGTCTTRTLNDRVLEQVQRLSDDKKMPYPEKVDHTADLLDILFAGKTPDEEQKEFDRLVEQGRPRLTPEAMELLYNGRIKGLLMKKDRSDEAKERDIQHLLDQLFPGKSPEEIEALLKRLEDGLNVPAEDKAKFHAWTHRHKRRHLSARRAAEDQKSPITSYEALDRANAKGRKLVVFEDNVLDVEDHIDDHPAEAAAIVPLIGREVGQMIYHKQVPDVTKERSSGRIMEGMPGELYAELRRGKEPSKYPWKIEIQDGLTDTFYRITFINENVALRRLHARTQHFGKYVTLVRKSDGAARNYVFVHTMQGGLEMPVSRLANAINGGKTEGDFATDLNTPIQNQLCVVATSRVAFSSWLISDVDIENEIFYIRGPFVTPKLT